MFNCTKCGACCRLAGIFIESSGIDFPYGFDEDGCCEKYDQEIGCTIYEERPEICRMNKMQLTSGLSEEEYNKRSILACNMMMDLLNIDESFKIPE
jgi:Fe-S-cluster containining protein